MSNFHQAIYNELIDLLIEEVGGTPLRPLDCGHIIKNLVDQEGINYLLCVLDEQLALSRVSVVQSALAYYRLASLGDYARDLYSPNHLTYEGEIKGLYQMTLSEVYYAVSLTGCKIDIVVFQPQDF